jgi:hypothetical protein
MHGRKSVTEKLLPKVKNRFLEICCFKSNQGVLKILVVNGIQQMSYRQNLFNVLLSVTLL